MRDKVITRASGQVKLDKNTHIYQLNTATGKVIRAELVETGHKQYKLIEFDGCLYLPAQSMEIAEATFATVFKAAKEGKVKLSWREKVAKWLTVLTINFRRWRNSRA